MSCVERSLPLYYEFHPLTDVTFAVNLLSVSFDLVLM